MTTFGPFGEEWEFGGFPFNTHAVHVRSIVGPDALPVLRGENAAYAGLPGRRRLGKLEDERRIALGLWVTSLDADGDLTAPTNREQARSNLDALKAVLGVRHAAQSLQRTMPDGSVRTALAECVAIDQIEDPASGEVYALVADFLLADPFMYGPDVVVVQAIGGSPTDFDLVSPGNRRGSSLLIDFTGPISNPRLANLTIDPGGDHYVELLVAVASGDHAIIDVARFLAENDGVNAIGSIRHSGSLPFLEIDPGTNSLRVTSSSPGGSVELTYSPPYI